MSKNKTAASDVLNRKEISSYDLFIKHPTAWTFRNIPKKEQTPDIAELAVVNDGLSLKFVSKKLYTADLCLKAVSQNGRALEYVPNALLSETIIEAALSCVLAPDWKGSFPILYVPEKFITHELALLSIETNPCSLKNIPKQFYSSDLFLEAVSLNGIALEFIPNSKKSKIIINAAIESNPYALQFVPEDKRTEDICTTAFQNEPKVLRFIPHAHISKEMCLKYIGSFPKKTPFEEIHFDELPEIFRNDYELIDKLTENFLPEDILAWGNKCTINEDATFIFSEDTINYIESKLRLQAPIDTFNLQTDDASCPTPAPVSTNLPPETLICNNVTHYLYEEDDELSQPIYYISDIHLEFQLRDQFGEGNVPLKDIENAINEKINEMLIFFEHKERAVILIGGDVSHSLKLTSLFYERLSCSLPLDATVIGVLGNHELWNGHPNMKDGYSAPAIDKIIRNYKNKIDFSSILGIGRIILNNQLFVRSKNRTDVAISEKEILDMKDKELSKICNDSSLIVLGGIGFSGLNPVYNAERGLYRSAVKSLAEDRQLSARFLKVYEKVLRCAGHCKVIVFTHTPVSNWTNSAPNPNWIYVNGHTHHNSFTSDEDQTIISDNQIGYRPKKWILKSFTLKVCYDPFINYNDGIYQISRAQYKDFNFGRGISYTGCNHDGDLYMMKSGKYYMFLLESEKNLCILNGGNRTKLDRIDKEYYFNLMNLYIQKLVDVINPYHKALKMISEEIKAFGGYGTIHGCIVDINFFNHVYLNPFDGKVTPYYAEDITSEIVFDNILQLLQFSLPGLLDRFLLSLQSGSIHILNNPEFSSHNNLPSIPSVVFETEAYKTSRIMRSIQYIYDKNVIRIWRESLLSEDFNNSNLLPEKQ